MYYLSFEQPNIWHILYIHLEVQEKLSTPKTSTSAGILILLFSNQTVGGQVDRLRDRERDREGDRDRDRDRDRERDTVRETER